MNINIYTPKEHLNSFYGKEWYLCTIDAEQKEKHKVEGTDIELFIDADKGLNNRTKNPNIGTITHVAGNAKFKVGERLLTKHFCFKDSNRRLKIFHQEDGVDYYRVTNHDIMFGIVNDELVPREGVLLCDKVFPKDTSIVGMKDIIGSRRDMVVVKKVWEGCTHIKEGDLVLIASGGDYLFDWNGEELIKVDTYMNDALAIVPSEDWEISEIRRHVKHEHNFKWK